MSIKVAFDIHGVIDSDVEKYKKILKRFTNITFTDDIEKMLATGSYRPTITVYIISGPPIEELIKELDTLGLKKNIHYHEVISVVTFLKEKGVDMWQDEKGTWWASDEEWWSSKGDICHKYGISILWDDSKGYIKRCEELGITLHLVED